MCQQPLIAVPYHYSEKDAENAARIVLSGKLHHDQGQEIISLEREFAGFVGAKYALAVNSCTSALSLAFQAIGLRPGDEVIVPAYTFIASAQAVLINGGTPVFADIDDTFTIDPSRLEHLITKKTRALMPVHLFGNVANMGAIMKVARKHKLAVVEDCAQAVGARYDGRDAGTIGDVGCYSFNIKKAIPTGQGGMLVTSDAKIIARARIARNTGIETKDQKTDVVSLGGTFFMTELEASLGRSVLRQLEHLNSTRKQNFEYLISLLEPLRRYVKPYRVLPKVEPSCSRLAFMVDFKALGISRRQFLAATQAEGIPVQTFYPTPLYRYSIFRRMRDNLPFVEEFCDKQVGTEFSPYWSFQDMRDIAQAFSKVLYLLSPNRKNIKLW